ncbi:MAG: hypothetical protein H6745_18030 [Deltaproteobacteria bacterium]|nr:hypothetical protein [Deltaproteobacteria bacterium]
MMLVCPSYVRTDIDRRALAGDGGPAPGGKAVVGRPAEPEDVARAVVSGIARRRRQLVLTPVGRAAYALSRLAPAVYERVMRRRQS